MAWLNDFTPSFTYHRDATAKTPARWVGANTAQLAQEAGGVLQAGQLGFVRRAPVYADKAGQRSYRPELRLVDQLRKAGSHFTQRENPVGALLRIASERLGDFPMHCGQKPHAEACAAVYGVAGVHPDLNSLRCVRNASGR